MGKLKISGKVKEKEVRMLSGLKSNGTPCLKGNFKRSLCQKMVGHSTPFR
jgi:hypothetical protein